MQQWEYMSFTLKISDSPDNHLSQLGAEGWELFSVIANSFSSWAMTAGAGVPDEYRYVLKRPRS